MWTQGDDGISFFFSDGLVSFIFSFSASERMPAIFLLYRANFLESTKILLIVSSQFFGNPKPDIACQVQGVGIPRRGIPSIGLVR